ncbi:M15 family metallopeptidase [Enterovibrio makurazakiensis]|uniref:M15 family metallopeptidase n=1 Tax=Enterovibrio makurazakiensis TaxID=2910232 RepID=UPI003D22CFD2
MMSGFVLGKRSLQELKGVHPDLVGVVERAIQITVQDFSVHDGMRTFAEQQALVARGASKTLNSRHLTGHAVDLVPYINGKLRWEWDPIYNIAEAVRIAAHEKGVEIRWGGSWSMLTDSEDSPEDMMADYAARCRRANKKPFFDGAHFELPKALYPSGG